MKISLATPSWPRTYNGQSVSTFCCARHEQQGKKHKEESNKHFQAMGGSPRNKELAAQTCSCPTAPLGCVRRVSWEARAAKPANTNIWRKGGSVTSSLEDSGRSIDARAGTAKPARPYKELPLPPRTQGCKHRDRHDARSDTIAIDSQKKEPSPLELKKHIWHAAGYGIAACHVAPRVGIGVL